MNSRLASTKSVIDVIIYKKSLSEVLPSYLEHINKPSDKGLYHQITYGTLRNYPSLVLNFSQFLNKKISKKNKKLEILLSIATYQLLFMEKADYAVINDMVNICEELNIGWAKGLANAVLRKVSKIEPQNIKVSPTFDQPKWLFDNLKKSYPNDYKEICSTHHTQAKTMLRTHNYNRDEYLKLLLDIPIDATAHPDSKEAIILNQNTIIPELPLFEEGNITVQDANAQLAANLLGLKDNMKVLDGCAAPGGKTAHIATKANNLDITAIDLNDKRVSKMLETFKRLQVDKNITIKTSKLEDLDNWFDGEKFDRILLDAPCSATGIIRKHPDILFHRTVEDIKELVKIQCQLLAVCWSLLKDDGVLVYATCSILPDENINQITKFITENNNAKLKSVAHNRGEKTDNNTIQFLPSEFGDGFFYAVIQKTTP